MRALLVLPVLLASTASAQLAPAVSFEAQGVFQSYEAGASQTVEQFAAPLRIGVGVGDFSLGVRTVYASTMTSGLSEGDSFADVSGLADTQLSLGFQRLLGGALVDLSLTANVPTGQTSLTEGEFSTSNAIAFDDYAFTLPSLGTGAMISPGLIIAIPAGPGLALGVGASYAARSSYTPFANDSTSYAPASETVLTAGLDASLGGASTFTLEGSYVLYGDDTFGETTFSPGNKATGTMRLALRGRLARGELLARYRQVFDGTIEARPVGYIRPSQAQVVLGLGFGPESASLGVSAGARYYGSIDPDADDGIELVSFLADQQVLLDLGAAPTIGLGESAELFGSFTYTVGLTEAIGGETLTGFRASGGIRTRF